MACLPHSRLSACLLACLQGRHRFLFLLFKQNGRVTVRPPSKRAGFQVRFSWVAQVQPALHWQLPSRQLPAQNWGRV
jgi:hypothetical protein